MYKREKGLSKKGPSGQLHEGKEGTEEDSCRKIVVPGAEEGTKDRKL